MSHTETSLVGVNHACKSNTGMHMQAGRIDSQNGHQEVAGTKGAACSPHGLRVQEEENVEPQTPCLHHVLTVQHKQVIDLNNGRQNR